MSSSLNVAGQGMRSADSLVKTLSNNIANANSKAFKADVASFTDLGYQTIVHPGAQASEDSGTVVPVGVQFGSGSKLASVNKDFRQGDLTNTDNMMSIAVQGKGMFAIEMPDGSVAYTRDGSFHIDPQTLQIVNSNGYVLSPAIAVPEDYKAIHFKDDGRVYATLPGEMEQQELGRIELVNFVNCSGLLANGNGLFSETEASGEPIVGNPQEEGMGSILQGYIEGSNVDAISQMVDLIKAQRAYEMNVKVMEGTGSMMRSLTSAA